VGAGDARLGGERVVGGELPSGEPEAVRDDGHVGALEDAELRVAVGVEGAVPVEVVGLEVQEDGDAAAQLVDVLELEGRELADDPLGGVRGGERRADVPRDGDVVPGGAEDRAEELGGRRLAVGAGDPDELRAAEEPVAELDLAPDGDAAAARFDDERVLARDAGALDEEADAVEEREVVIVPELAVGADDIDAAGFERIRRRRAGARQPEYEDSLRDARLVGGDHDAVAGADPSLAPTHPRGRCTVAHARTAPCADFAPIAPAVRVSSGRVRCGSSSGSRARTRSRTGFP
jgi:hypothetical protein